LKITPSVVVVYLARWVKSREKLPLRKPLVNTSDQLNVLALALMTGLRRDTRCFGSLYNIFLGFGGSLILFD
jgi:hypothetical protein